MHLSILQLSIYLPSLLLGQTRIESLNQAFRDQSEEGGPAGIIMLAVVVCAISVAVLAYFAYKRRTERVFCDANQLLKEVGRAHRLNRQQRSLLVQLAKAKQLEDPCALLLDTSHWILDPVKHPQLCQPRKIAQIQMMQRRLFVAQ